jgi:hypothetical protein
MMMMMAKKMKMIQMFYKCFSLNMSIQYFRWKRGD